MRDASVAGQQEEFVGCCCSRTVHSRHMEDVWEF